MSRIAIIGGSGFSNLPGLDPLGEENPETPYGQPSAPILHGRLEGGEVFSCPAMPPIIACHLTPSITAPIFGHLRPWA
jgi:purine nucleoside phosphorylase